MSDNIDYAELDKAVNEAIQSRSAAKPRAAIKPVAKPATAMHHSHGQFMDFAPVKSHVVSRPASISAKPITRPNTVHPVARPAIHTIAPARPTVARPALRPAAPKITTAPQPAIVPRSAKIGSAVKPIRPSVSSQIQHKQQIAAAKPAVKPAVTKPIAKPIATPVAKPVAKPVEKPVAKPAVKPAAKPAPKAEEKPATKPAAKPAVVEKKASKAEEKKSAPNANNYSLGVRSPFMTNTKVEKRPLGKDIPETSVSNLHSTKNIYSSKSPNKSSTKPVKKKHMVTEAPKKHSGWLWTLVVLLVLGAGAGIGYLAYILLFAK